MEGSSNISKDNENRRAPYTCTLFPKSRANKWVWFRCFEHCLHSGTNLNRQPQIVSHSRRCLFFPLLLVIRDASPFLPSPSLSPKDIRLQRNLEFQLTSAHPQNGSLSFSPPLSLTTRRNLSGGCVFQWDDTERSVEAAFFRLGSDKEHLALALINSESVQI